MKHEATNFLVKQSFAGALKKAAEHKPFARITVSELVRECGVNRKTFYYHFDDIYALLKWTLEQDAFEVVKQFDLITEYKEAIVFVMDYVEKNEIFLKNIYDSVGRDELKRFLYLDFTEVVYSMVRETEKQTGIFVEDGYRDFLCNFYTEAIAGTLLDWIGKRQDRDKMLEYVKMVFRGGLPAAVREWAADSKTGSGKKDGK